MNLRIGRVKNFNNKIMISKPDFNLDTNLKINLDDEKDKPDVNPKKEPNIKFEKEGEQDVKMTRTKSVTHEEEKVALVLGMTAVFTALWIFK